MFSIMLKVGIPHSFVDKVKLLSQDAGVAVNLNSRPTKSFPIYRVVNQGCLVAPCLFLIIMDALKKVVKASIACGQL